MEEYICDDRFDYIEHGKRINKMTDEEFYEYIKEMENKETRNSKKKSALKSEN